MTIQNAPSNGLAERRMGTPGQDSVGRSPQYPTPSSSQNRDRKGHISALTVQLTAQELEAEGAASVARNRVQPYVLRL